MRNFTHSAVVTDLTDQTMSNQYKVMRDKSEVELDQQDVKFITTKLRSIKRRFPTGVEVDEVVVLEDLEGNMAEAVQTVRAGVVNYYIYLDEKIFNSEDWIVEATMAHEMVHLYCYQKGYDDLTDGDPMFEWMCGRVGALQTNFNPKEHQFKELIVPFMKQADYYPSDNSWD